MNLGDYKSSAAGRCIRARGGYLAFVPQALPPALEIDLELAKLISDADRALGELSAVGRLLPNPQLLIGPYSRREAVLSSRIEGTQAGMEDLLLYEAVKETPSTISDVKEVANYVVAMRFGLQLLKKLPISGRFTREIHAKLLRGVRGGYATPGEFRTTQNWIGPPGCDLNTATYVPPPVGEMEDALAAWEKYLHSDPKEPVLIQGALMHYQFEALHSFVDGNGRVGRMLITLFLHERGVLSYPLLCLSMFFERYRDDYYRHLLRVSQKGEYREWIAFFLRGVAVQAKDGLKETHLLIALHEKYKTMVTGKRIPKVAIKLVDHLFTNPVVSVARLSRMWRIPFPTVSKGVEKLEQLGILTEKTGQRRNKLYIAEHLLKLIGRGT